MTDTPCTRFCAAYPDCDCGRDREKARAEPPMADRFAEIAERMRQIEKEENVE